MESSRAGWWQVHKNMRLSSVSTRHAEPCAVDNVACLFMSAAADNHSYDPFRTAYNTHTPPTSPDHLYGACHARPQAEAKAEARREKERERAAARLAASRVPDDADLLAEDAAEAARLEQMIAALMPKAAHLPGLAGVSAPAGLTPAPAAGAAGMSAGSTSRCRGR